MITTPRFFGDQLIQKNFFKHTLFNKITLFGFSDIFSAKFSNIFRAFFESEKDDEDEEEVFKFIEKKLLWQRSWANNLAI